MWLHVYLMPLTGTPVESKGVVQRNLFQSFLGACAFGGTRTWLVLRQISNVLHDKLVEPLKPLIILIEVNNTCWYLGNQAKNPRYPKIFQYLWVTSPISPRDRRWPLKSSTWTVTGRSERPISEEPCSRLTAWPVRSGWGVHLWWWMIRW